MTQNTCQIIVDAGAQETILHRGGCGQPFKTMVVLLLSVNAVDVVEIFSEMGSCSHQHNVTF